MGTKSKPFRAFVEGNTISDGRQITSAMIDDIAATFSTANYSPRINIEHIQGFSPEPPFNGYGTVIAVEAKTDDFTIDGKSEKRRALYCTVDGNDQLVTLAKADQKPFPSVELTPDYAGTGKVGLIGLAFTDTPASIGTQALQFSRTSPGTLFAACPDAVDITFEEAPADPSAGAFSAMAAFYNRLMGNAPKPADPVTPPTPANTNTPAPANDNDFAVQMREGFGLINAGLVALGQKQATDIGAIRTEFATLTGKLATTEAPGFNRAPASGGSAEVETDC